MDMRIDKIEFQDSLRSESTIWYNNDQEMLERFSIIRRIGTRVTEHRDGFPVIPTHHDRLIITNGVPGVMHKLLADHHHCVSTQWCPLMVSGIVPGLWRPNTMEAENIFLTNSLTFSDITTHHIREIDDVHLVMKSCDHHTFLLLPTIFGNVPEGPTALKGETYQLFTMQIPDSHPSHFKSVGYLIRPGAICYDVTDVTPSPDDLSASWNIRIIISDPCDVQRFSIHEPLSLVTCP